MSDYANPTALVSAEWARAHLDDPSVRFVDVEWDREAYEAGHLRGAVAWAWEGDLIDPVRRDLVDTASLAGLLSRSGIDQRTQVVLYGDNDWYAAWALWQLKGHGLERVSLLDGGRGYWRAQGFPLETDEPDVEAATHIELTPFRASTRMTFAELRDRVGDTELAVLDVRTLEEYAGAVTAPAGYPAIAQRAGHVPGAVRAPWEDTLADDGRFRSVEELRAHFAAFGLSDDDEVTMYCGVGVRSSHTWFVLHELLGYRRARNYDGSWAEWGSVIGAPIETATGSGVAA